MLLECCDFLIQIEQPRYKHFDLIIGEMAERRFEQRGHILLNVHGIIGYGSKEYRNLIRLYQREHIGENLGMHRNTRRMRCVRHH